MELYFDNDAIMSIDDRPTIDVEGDGSCLIYPAGPDPLRGERGEAHSPSDDPLRLRFPSLDAARDWLLLAASELTRLRFGDGATVTIRVPRT
jgi:hypothetical protein